MAVRLTPKDDNLERTEYGTSVGTVDALEALKSVSKALMSCEAILEAIIVEVENARQA